MSTVTFSAALLREIAVDGEKHFPEETCGLVFGKAGAATRVVAMPNVYAKYARLDPVRFPRDNRTAYKMDELKVMNLVEEAQRQGETLVCIYHSHTNGRAYFSAEDKLVALAEGGAPLWPGTEYLVLAVAEGKAVGAKCFAWDGKDFAERDVALPA